MINALSKSLLRLRNRHFIIIDAIAFLITPVLALLLRLDENFSIEEYGVALVIVTILFLTIKLSVLCGFGFYKRCWRYASIDELTQITALIAAAVILQSLLFYLLVNVSDFFGGKITPRSLPLLDGMLSLIFVGGFRFSIRAVERVHQRRAIYRQGERVLIVGAGDAGISLVQQMQRNPQLGLYPVAFIDDDPIKLNLRIRGLSVVGDRNKIPEIVRSLGINKVIISMPSVSGKVIREIVDICQTAGVRTSTLPNTSRIRLEEIKLGVDSYK